MASIADLVVKKNDPDLFQAIGTFVYQFSQFEASLRYTLAELTIRRHSDVIMAALDFAILCRALSEVISRSEKCSPNAKEKMRSALGLALKVNDERVKIAHGTWTIDDKEGLLESLSRQSLKRQKHYSNHEEVAALAAKQQGCTLPSLMLTS